MADNGISTGIASDTHQLMQDIKDRLLRLKQSPTDPALANSIPGTARAIKNMDDLDKYKHAVTFLSALEAVLSRVRNGELKPKADLIALLLICCDHASRISSELAQRDEIYLGDLKRSHGLVRQLHAYQRNKFEHIAAA